MENVDLAYVAGIFDGEGCVLIYKVPRHNQKRGGIQHRLKISIANTNTDLMSWLKENFGGNIVVADRREQYRKFYHWQLSGVSAAEFIKRLLPYLKIKQQQVKLAISFQETIKSPQECGEGKIIPQGLLALRDNFKQLIHELNSGRQINESYL